MTQVNKERMLAEFKEIVALPCHSLQERPVFELLKGKLEALGFTVEEDDAGEKLGGNCGNMWAFLPASAGVEGAVRVLLSAHMDGVEPCGGTTVIQKDGVLYSDGTTILGGDDKSGVEGILEGIRLLLEEGAPHGDIQILFTDYNCLTTFYRRSHFLYIKILAYQIIHMCFTHTAHHAIYL